MAHSTVILDKRFTKRDGTFPIKIRIFHVGTFYISLNIDIFENQWQETNKDILKAKMGIVINHQLAARYNNLISSRKLEIDRKLLELTDSRQILKMDNNQLKEFITKEHTKQKAYTFIEHYDKYVSCLSKDNTISSLKYTYAKISKFCNIETLRFQDINYEWLKEFDLFMAKGEITINTRGIYMRNIKAIFNDAINCDRISLALYPFRKFKIQKEATQKRSLTIDELRRLKNMTCSNTQAKYRDFFLLLFYLMGVNTIDVAGIKDVVNERIQYKRSKTNKLYDIKITPPAMEIINKYKGTNCLLSFYDNKTTYRNFSLKANAQLKKLCTELDTNDKENNTTVKFPRISTYWARHTWATIAAGLDIPKETIAAALGHGGNTVTDIYINFDQRKVDEANRKVIDFVLGKEKQ